MNFALAHSEKKVDFEINTQPEATSTPSLMRPEPQTSLKWQDTSLTPTFPFFRLPSELRNQIYQLTFASTAMHVGTEIPGLLLACRQIFNECVKIFYTAAAFYVENREALCRWLKRLSEKYKVLISEIWCSQNTSLPGSPWTTIARHGISNDWVSQRMSRRLKKLETTLRKDVLRVSVGFDEFWEVWASNPRLVYELAVEARVCIVRH